ncbi:MAG TPA: hypothetical protein VHD63_24595 [Ktedonobacteraceae bacterium]|nr:hypothetical protein [Ktedonobacteraceae bacterium]
MMIAVEGSSIRTTPIPYELTDELPFGLLFAQRRHAADYLAKKGATQSDGSTSGQDGTNGGTEDFDWLTDD